MPRKRNPAKNVPTQVSASRTPAMQKPRISPAPASRRAYGKQDQPEDYSRTQFPPFGTTGQTRDR